MALELEPLVRRRWVGAPVPRKEDLRLVVGQGTYADDITLPGTAHAAIVRSPYPRARILGIDAGRALALPGVLAVITGAEMARQLDPYGNLLAPPYDRVADYGIAVDVARYAGEPVAVVVAEDKYLAHDAVDLVDVSYEPLPAVLSGEQGLAPDAPRVHDDVPSNVMWQRRFTYGDVEGAFRRADLVVRERLRFHRFTSAPLEPTVALARYEPASRGFTIWSNNQRPGFNQRFMAHALRIPTSRLRLITPDIGGGFGIKNDTYPYLVLMAVAARHVGRPVKWVETRHEHMLASAHGQDVVYDGEMALSADGTILGVRARAIHDDGAYMRREPVGAFNFIRHATLTYNFRNLEMDIHAVATDKCPVGPNRSYGKMQQCYLIDRLLDIGARRLGIDPLEIRLRNAVLPEQMPYETPTGAVLDGGDYPAALRKVAGDCGYEELRAEQERLRAEGRLVGIGLAMGMDACPINFASNRIMNPGARVSGDSEACWVKVDEDGNVTAAIGTSPQGQGHETVVAQLVADELGLSPDDVDVLPGFDSAVNLYTPHSGTYASRFAIAGAASVVGAARKVRDRVLHIAAHLLGTPLEDLSLEGGRVVMAGGESSLTLQDVAHVAWRDQALLPEGDEAGIVEHCIYRTPFGLPVDEQRGNFSFTYSYAACLVVVEVDRETGMVEVRRIAIVEDCGNQLNPLIVEGQIHGQIAHQLGAALYEQLAYDDAGQLLTASFKDYLAPTARDLPNYEVDSITVPSLFTPLGTRGNGEGGGSPLIAAVNAVADALAPLGIAIDTTYLDPTVLRRRIREVEAAAAAGPGRGRVGARSDTGGVVNPGWVLNGHPAGTLALAIAVLVAGVAKGISGMGLPIVATPVAAVVFGLRTAIGVMILPTVVTDVVILAVVCRGRAGPAAGRLARLVPPAVCGIWFGVQVLAHLDPGVLSAVLGLVVLSFVIANTRGWLRRMRRPPPWVDPCVGLLCGFLQGAVGASGPVLTMYLYQLDLERPEFLFTSNGFFLAVDSVQLLSMARVGLETAPLLHFAALACLPALAGMAVPLALQRRVTPRIFRATILAMLTAAAVTLLAKEAGLPV